MCRAHQHAAGARKQGEPQREPPGGVFAELADHGLGRSRGGFTTKLHLAVEQGQKPMSILITAGQRGDSPQFEPVLARIRVPRIGPGRPRIRPHRVRAIRRTPPKKPRLPAPARNPPRHPGQGRPSAQPSEPRLPQWPATAFRPSRLPGTPRGRVRDQPPQQQSTSGCDQQCRSGS
ncbi:hypothetical protein ACFPEN_34085 [Streptomyces ehimensis]|uniref:Transposase n=1 Tax=Streptomyces ehimensis TaxID=68195 RepID=A0ABV9BV72_9ACTN